MTQKREGRTLIISVDDDAFYYELTGLKASTWDLIDGKADLSKILQELKSKVPDRIQPRLEKELFLFIEELMANQLIVTL